MSRIAGVVILYNPDKTLIKNILSYFEHVDAVYLMDNSMIESDFLDELLLSSKIKYFHDGLNEGISKRLNQAIDIAAAAGMEYLLTMDQDSHFENDSFRQYISFLPPFKDQRIGMFGVNHENQSTKPEEEVERDAVLITSGSIINLQWISEMGKFDENLFIDSVDDDYCLNIFTKGLHTIKFNHIYLHHQLGMLTKCWSFTRRKVPKVKVLHPPIRLYYIIRNLLYLQKKYPNKFHDFFEIKKADIKTRVKNSLLYSNNRLYTIKMVIKAFTDFYRNRMGKYRED